MSTAGEIIQDAFREGNFIPVGDVPTAAQISEALPRLNSLVVSLFGNELGVALRDWLVPASWSTAQEQRHPLTPTTETTSSNPWAYPPENSRLVVSIGSARTVYFPGNPRDGAMMAMVDVGSASVTLTLSGNGRLIQGATTVAGTPSSLNGRRWIYRADTSDWTLISDITAEATSLPLPKDYDDLFVTGLAVRLSTRYGIALEPHVAERYTDMLSRVVNRYRPESRPLNSTELRAQLRVTP